MKSFLHSIHWTNSIKSRILTISSDADTRNNGLKGLLLLLSLLYGTLVRLRLRRYTSGAARIRNLSCQVISIGNLTAGGTGKTPTTIHLAIALTDMGYRVAILSRGYKGTAEQRGAIVSDGRSLLLGPEQAGDEPYLLACLLPHVPVIVGADRYAGGCLAMQLFHPDIILLDDGFQHLQIHRDLNILLLDARSPLGNGYLLPRGRLREPPESLNRADVLIYTRSDSARATLQTKPECLDLDTGHRPVFHCRHKPLLRLCIPKNRLCRSQALADNHTITPGPWLNASMFAFAGLARNDTFWRTVIEMGGKLVDTKGYPDHYAYTSNDIAEINRAALQNGCRYIVTTDKDFVRLPPDCHFAMDLLVCGVEIEFAEYKECWRKFLIQWIKSDGEHG